MPKLSVSELLHRACVIAEMSLACGDDNHDNELELQKQIRDYRIKRWGRNKLDEFFDTAQVVSIEELAKGPDRVFEYKG